MLRKYSKEHHLLANALLEFETLSSEEIETLLKTGKFEKSQPLTNQEVQVKRAIRKIKKDINERMHSMETIYSIVASKNTPQFPGRDQVIDFLDKNKLFWSEQIKKLENKDIDVSSKESMT